MNETITAEAPDPEAPDPETLDKDALSQARELVSTLERGNRGEATEIIGSLYGQCETSLYRQIVSLVHELHQTLEGFKLDPRIVALTESEMPDARERLNYVLTLTGQAAHRTLGAVEHCLPIAEELSSRAGKMGRLCAALESDTSCSTATRALAPEIREIRTTLLHNAEALHAHLSDVLMAQSFQDLTGQIIRRVVDLVQELEEKLTCLVDNATGSQPGETAQIPKSGSAADPIAAQGPHVPGVDEPGSTQDQDDVDGLLSKPGI